MAAKVRALPTLAAVLLGVPGAQATPREPVRLLVLPAIRGPGVDAAFASAIEGRLVVALQRTPGLSPTTPRDVDDLIAAQRLSDLIGGDQSTCIAALGEAVGADQVLAIRLVQTGDALSCFLAVHDVGSGRTLRRRELRGLRQLDVAAARELAAWIGGARARLPHRLLDLSVSGELSPGQTDALAGAVESALGSVDTVHITTGADTATHAAEITVTTLEVVRRRHHIHRYLDGTLVATLRISEREGAVLFTRQVRVTLSERARYSTPDRVVAELCEHAARQWSTAVRATITF